MAKHRFEYRDNGPWFAENVSVIGSFNQFDPAQGQMTKTGGTWTLDRELPPGEYMYRFLVNGEIEFNDPYANIYYPDDNNKLYSVILVDKDGKRRYNNTEYTVHIDSYSISGEITRDAHDSVRKTYDLNRDKQVVTRFGFSSVTGLHTVTAVWMSPDGKVFEYSENVLFTPEEDTRDPIYIWFWLSLERELLHGPWDIFLYIDGEFILEDTFDITVQKSLYESTMPLYPTRP